MSRLVWLGYFADVNVQDLNWLAYMNTLVLTRQISNANQLSNLTQPYWRLDLKSTSTLLVNTYDHCHVYID